MKRIQITITEKLLEKLAEEQELTGLSRSELIRRALDRYFEKKGGKNE